MESTQHPPIKRRSAREKLEILDATKNWSISRISERYDVSRATVQTWRANESQLRQLPGSARRLRHPSYAPSSASVRSEVASPPRQRAEGQAGACNASNRSALAVVDATQTPPTAPTQARYSSGETLERLPSTAAREIRVGFAGQRGTPAELALRNASPSLHVGASRSDARCVSAGYSHVLDAIDGVAKRETDFCVVPAELLLSLSSSSTLRAFTLRPLQNVAEIAWRARLCLSAVPGMALRDCDCVMSDARQLQSHGAAIRKLERARSEPIVRQAAWDSAGACTIVREQDAHGIAVLATAEAAADAGLSVLGCADGDRGGTSRFLLLGRLDSPTLLPRSRADSTPEAARATTVLVRLRNQPGWLSSFTFVFAGADAQVTDIQTRLAAAPASRPRERRVLATFTAAADDEPSALPCQFEQQLDALTLSKHVLGTYFALACGPSPRGRRGAA